MARCFGPAFKDVGTGVCGDTIGAPSPPLVTDTVLSVGQQSWVASRMGKMMCAVNEMVGTCMSAWSIDCLRVGSCGSVVWLCVDADGRVGQGVYGWRMVGRDVCAWGLRNAAWPGPSTTPPPRIALLPTARRLPPMMSSDVIKYHADAAAPPCQLVSDIPSRTGALRPELCEGVC
ncbi:hypothetical protein Pyn_31461 [Prunus yedoensis var. nudiflora]|uniref:Uncharacterized protein n=1 Tax=Prunus yedoensis var. nudiflora TaxID=2094558 RepID=A0A314ZRJ2_PRUYE|nr:hypothetical protein Pyn_31461 [Prunus yedoensis var. nudiflora]